MPGKSAQHAGSLEVEFLFSQLSNYFPMVVKNVYSITQFRYSTFHKVNEQDKVDESVSSQSVRDIFRPAWHWGKESLHGRAPVLDLVRTFLLSAGREHHRDTNKEDAYVQSPDQRELLNQIDTPIGRSVSHDA